MMKLTKRRMKRSSIYKPTIVVQHPSTPNSIWWVAEKTKKIAEKSDKKK